MIPRPGTPHTPESAVDRLVDQYIREHVPQRTTRPLPPATCPSLDRLARLARRLEEPHRSRALAEVEWLREAHLLLRAAAAARGANPTEVVGSIRRREGYEARALQEVDDRPGRIRYVERPVCGAHDDLEWHLEPDEVAP